MPAFGAQKWILLQRGLFPGRKGHGLVVLDFSSPIVEEQIGSHLHVSSFVGLVATRTPTYLYGNKANDKAKVADSYR